MRYWHHVDARGVERVVLTFEDADLAVIKAGGAVTVREGRRSERYLPSIITAEDPILELTPGRKPAQRDESRTATRRPASAWWSTCDRCGAHGLFADVSVEGDWIAEHWCR